MYFPSVLIQFNSNTRHFIVWSCKFVHFSLHHWTPFFFLSIKYARNLWILRILFCIWSNQMGKYFVVVVYDKSSHKNWMCEMCHKIVRSNNRNNKKKTFFFFFESDCLKLITANTSNKRFYTFENVWATHEKHIKMLSSIPLRTLAPFTHFYYSELTVDRFQTFNEALNSQHSIWTHLKNGAKAFALFF